MHDAEDEDDAGLVDDVVHDAVVADPQPVEGIAGTMHGLHGLAFDSADLRRTARELLERQSDPSTNAGFSLPEGLCRRGTELDAICVQVRSDRATVRPSA